MIHVQEVCRFCFSRAGNLFSVPLTSLEHLDLLNQWLNLSTDLLDTSVLPRQVCDECSLIINRFINLRDIARRNDSLVFKWQNEVGFTQELIVPQNELTENNVKRRPSHHDNIYVFKAQQKFFQRFEDKISNASRKTDDGGFQTDIPCFIEDFNTEKVTDNSKQSDVSNEVKEKDSVINYEIDSSKENAVNDTVPNNGTANANFVTSKPLSEDPSEIYSCNYCEEICYTQKKLVSHLQTHTQTMVKCPSCVPEKFMTGYALRKHLKNVHKLIRDIPCEYDGCGKLFKQREVMKNHVKYVHLKEYSLCNLCGASVRDRSYHVQSCNKNYISKNICDICSKQLSCKVSLSNHMKTVHGENTTTTCNICGKEVSYMKSHLKHKHANPDDNTPKISCKYPDCQALFKSKSSAAKHFKVLHLEEKQQCHVCHLWLKNLRGHLQVTHQRGKKYQCDDCGKIFFRGNHLKVHMAKVHLGTSTRFSCPECGKSVVKIKEHIKSVHGTEMHA